MFEREFCVDLGKIIAKWKEDKGVEWMDTFLDIERLHTYFKKREEEYLQLTTKPSESDLLWNPM